MRIFIATNEPESKSDIELLENGFSFRPFDINAYKYHLSASKPEKTQKRLIKNVTTGTLNINKGKA